MYHDLSYNMTIYFGRTIFNDYYYCRILVKVHVIKIFGRRGNLVIDFLRSLLLAPKRLVQPLCICFFLYILKSSRITKIRNHTKKLSSLPLLTTSKVLSGKYKHCISVHWQCNNTLFNPVFNSIEQVDDFLLCYREVTGKRCACVSLSNRLTLPIELLSRCSNLETKSQDLNVCFLIKVWEK